MLMVVLALNQIAPIWCNVLSKWPRLNSHEREAIRYDLKMHTRCIMAEVYFWSDGYTAGRPQYCKECDYYAFSFSFIINGPDNILDTELFETKGKEFCQHFMAEHLKIQEQKEDKILFYGTLLGCSKKTKKKSTEKR